MTTQGSGETLAGILSQFDDFPEYTEQESDNAGHDHSSRNDIETASGVNNFQLQSGMLHENRPTLRR